jgi:hypothetical protein
MLMAYFEERGYRHISRGNETRGYFGTILNAIGEQLRKSSRPRLAGRSDVDHISVGFHSGDHPSVMAKDYQRISFGCSEYGQPGSGTILGG